MADNGITLKMAMESLFCNEELSDVQFEGTDGGVVPAFRCILAARSPVFRSLLFGNFSEAKEDGLISLGYSSAVLKSVVQFCLTDEAAILQAPSPQASKVMELVDAANYYELPELKRKAQEFITEEISRRPETASVILQEAVSMSLGSIEEVARKAIRTKPNETLLEGDSVTNLSLSVLKSVISDKRIHASELTLFRVLLAWAGQASGGTARQAEAQDLAKSLALEEISPSELRSLVEESELVSQDQLMRAYRTQAIQAEEKYSVQYDRMRHILPCLWQGSESSVACGSRRGSYDVALLQLDFTICTGIWKWSVEVEELSNCTWIGVASTSHNLDLSEWLGNETGGWVYGNNGSACTPTMGQGRGPFSFPVFKSGNVVSMTLDLTDGRGTLFASVDGGGNYQLFSNMLDSFGEDREVGFLPAVSLKSPGRVRFLGLEDVGTS